MIVAGSYGGRRNRRTGGGYRVRIKPRDRDKCFRQTWASVTVEFDNGGVVRARLSPSFWRTCPELRRKEIEKWMIDQGFARWQKGKPPKFRLDPIGDRRFRLSRL